MRVTARLDTPLSRWLWLVKWIAAIPHYVVLAFLWVGFVLLSVFAFFAILFTGRYPRSIFEFNVGVLRWSWRVQYYTYGALATDRYPPFTLADVPDYPARLDIAYPDHLSRGLVLVKWWLLAIPHYVVVGLFLGGGSWLAVRAGSDSLNWAGGGLIGLLVLVAGVVLLFTGRYPRPLFDFVLGLNRWVLRVAAYAGLMTDEYPPFRLDMGGDEGGGTTVLPPPAAPPDTGRQPGTIGTAPPPPPTAPRWSAGRVVSVVAGALLLLVSMGLFAGGGAALWFDNHRDGGYVTSGQQSFVSSGYAITTERLSLGDPGWSGGLQSDILGTVRVRATSEAAGPVFVGIAPATDVARYLGGVGHTQLQTFTNHANTVTLPGGGPAATPTSQTFWAAQAVGTGRQVMTWSVRDGDWAIVAMNADASPGVAVRVDVGATAPALEWAGIGALIAAGLLLAAGSALVAAPLRRASRS